MSSIMRYSIIMMILFAFLVSEITNAQKNDSIYVKSRSFDKKRFSLTAGAFVSGLVSRVRFGNKQLGLGLDINIEDALGLNTSNFVFRSSAMYYIGKKRKHSIKASYFAFLRTANKVLEAELEFNDYIYPVGTKINSLFNLTIVKLAYDYSFFKDDRVDLGIGGGFYIMPIRFELTVKNRSTNNIADFIAPLPYASLRTDFKIIPKLYLKQGINLMYAQFDNYSGAIIDISLIIEHNTRKHFGFGAGLDAYKIVVRSESSKNNLGFIGNIEIGYTGLLFFAKYYF